MSLFITCLQEAKPLFDAKTLFDGLVGALAGGVISAVMTIRFEKKRSQTDVSLEFLKQFLEQYDELGAVKGLLLDPGSLQNNPSNVNKVRKLGDWFEIVSAASLAGLTDDSLLDRVGIASEIKQFHGSAIQVEASVTDMPNVGASWPNLVKYVSM